MSTACVHDLRGRWGPVPLWLWISARVCDSVGYSTVCFRERGPRIILRHELLWGCRFRSEQGGRRWRGLDPIQESWHWTEGGGECSTRRWHGKCQIFDKIKTKISGYQIFLHFTHVVIANATKKVQTYLRDIQWFLYLDFTGVYIYFFTRIWFKTHNSQKYSYRIRIFRNKIHFLHFCPLPVIVPLFLSQLYFYNL